MAYTALAQMRINNEKNYGISYPAEPAALGEKKSISNIEKACLNFLTNRCEELNFRADKAELTDLDGKSISPGQIPYNMEKDIDRLCLVNAIHRFMRSGVAQDAFDVYFCYLEMFIGEYGKSKKMIEMLAEFESNGSALLMRHRDHYSHSVYVFILGLAIYHENEPLRRAFREHYGFETERAADHAFIHSWGLAALFHDIGYPFELPFEQVKSYFGSVEGVPFVCYGGLGKYLQADEDPDVFGGRNINRVLAEGIAEKLWSVYGGGLSCGEYAEKLCSLLDKRPTEPGEFMDHAYFSAVILLKQLVSMRGAAPSAQEMDALTAIALHNSLYKYSVTSIKSPENKPLVPELHPLAYLLMLCDELQCWDRISYGKNSRQELHPMWCDLEFSGEGIMAHYYYDRTLENRRERGGTFKKMKAEADATPEFITEIEKIVAINRPGRPALSLDTAFVKNNRDTRTFISSSSFLHLYNFAVALNARYFDIDPTTQDAPQIMEDAFQELSLEYKLSNILQAKAFAGYLDKINCFYTDKPVQYELLEEFSEANMDVIGPLEHARWVNEKLSMGWALGSDYESEEVRVRSGAAEGEWKARSRQLRELTRTHKLMIDDYNELDKAEQDKDTKPMNRMLELVSEYDGLRIYRL